MVQTPVDARDPRYSETGECAGDFFIIGKNGQAYPDLMRRLVNEGHEIGNHTYTHPNLGEIPSRLPILNSTPPSD